MKEHNGRENIQNSIVYIFKLLKFKYKISIKENVNWFQKCGTILGIKEFVLITEDKIKKWEGVRKEVCGSDADKAELKILIRVANFQINS